MSNLALYQIAETYREALDKLADMGLPDQIVSDTLGGIEGDLQIKATNISMLVRNLESLAESIKNAEENMSHRRRVIENRCESIREYIKNCMETAGIQKIECPYFKLSVKKNPPSVEITDEASVPAIYMRVPLPPPPSIDKKLILETLKEGTNIPGTRLLQRTRLEIK